MAKNLKLLIFLLSAMAALQGCNDHKTTEEAPPEKGQFKVVLKNDTGQTKGFWEVDPEKRKLGEPCEQELHSVTILVYNRTWMPTDPPAYIGHFSPAELARKSSIFTLPHGTTASDSKPKLSFLAFANFKVKTDGMEANLPVIPLGHISDYAATTKLRGPSGFPDSLMTVNFSDIYPNGPSAPAVALRNDIYDSKDYTKGRGFAMSSLPVLLDMKTTDDPNVPREIHLKLARAVSRIEIRAKTTPEFAAKYPGSTLIITNLLMNRMPKHSFNSIATQRNPPPAASQFVTMDQTPYNTTVDGLLHQNFIFYCYENTQSTTVAPPDAFRPQIEIRATFDFDGDPATKDDVANMMFRNKPAMSNGNGSIFRNTLYQIEINLNGLSEREVISTVEVLPWDTIYEEINFGG